MGNLRFAAAILFVAACGSDHGATPDAAKQIDAKPIDAKVWMDAPPPMYDFSCSTNPAPAAGSATATISIAGTVTALDIQGTTPSTAAVAGATLKACKAGAANCSGLNQYGTTQTSASDGSYTISGISTLPSMDPIDGFIAATATNDRPTYVFPPQKLAADLPNAPVFMFTNTAFATLNTFTSGGQQAANGNLVVIVTDCMNKPIDGATITVKQNGTAVNNISDFDLGAASSMAAGLHVVFNVPPGATEVNASINNMSLHAHSVDVFMGGSTSTIVRPGYL